MLSFLTDAHISPRVAEQVKVKRPEVVIYSLQEWRGGTLLKEDDVILAAAVQERLAFVTYDQRTIAPLVMQWAMDGRDHAGVIFIDDKSIAQQDVGGKVLALISLWELADSHDWTNALSYLKADA